MQHVFKRPNNYVIRNTTSEVVKANLPVESIGDVEFFHITLAQLKELAIGICNRNVYVEDSVDGILVHVDEKTPNILSNLHMYGSLEASEVESIIKYYFDMEVIYAGWYGIGHVTAESVRKYYFNSAKQHHSI